MWAIEAPGGVRLLSTADAGVPAPDRIAVGTGAGEVVVYDRTTGEQVGDPIAFAASWAEVEGDLLITGAADADPSDGCAATVAAYRIGEAEPLWEAETATRASFDGEQCAPAPHDIAEGLMPLSPGGTPTVVDVATGESVWTGDEPAQALAVAEGTAATASWELGPDNFSGYDLATGQLQWRTTAAIESSAVIHPIGSTLWMTTLIDDVRDLHTVRAVGLRTGEVVTVPGEKAEFRGDRVLTFVGEPTRDHPAGRYAWAGDLWK